MLVFAIVLLVFRLLAPNLFLRAVAPLFSASDALAAWSHAMFSGFKNASSLAVENEQLAQQNTALTNENQALSQKVTDLRILMCGQGVSASTVDAKCPHAAPQGILAGVVARPPESPYDTLVLAAGTDAGIALGMGVFGAGNVPLGIVSSVSTDFSRVTLFSAPGVTTDGWIVHAHTTLPVTIAGTGAGALTATLARSADVAAGDAVFVPGPGMLPIGNVARVDRDPSSPSVTLSIAPATNLFSIAWVTIRDTGAALLRPTTLSP